MRAAIAALLQLLTAAFGTKRRLRRRTQVERKRSEADIERLSLR
jgi:hypothetical protein